jgi:hypothetical protein
LCGWHQTVPGSVEGIHAEESGFLAGRDPALDRRLSFLIGGFIGASVALFLIGGNVGTVKPPI